MGNCISSKQKNSHLQRQEMYRPKPLSCGYQTPDQGRRRPILESVYKPQCKICLSPYDDKERTPMSLSCFHTFCESCIKKIEQCPLDQKKIVSYGKNFQLFEYVTNSSQKLREKSTSESEIRRGILMSRRQTVQSQLPILQFPKHQPRKPLVCENNHELTWIKQKVRCGTCSQIASCFNCAQCMYNKCMKCADYKHRKGICPSYHPTKWHSIRSQCASCSKFNRGWECLDHSYKLCDECAKTPFLQTACPNGHNTVWYHNPANCTKCEKPSSCWSCKICLYSLCDKCIEYQYNKSKCPNGHQTIAKEKQAKCFKCNQIRNSGWCCDVCSYYFCYQCKEQKQH